MECVPRIEYDKAYSRYFLVRKKSTLTSAPAGRFAGGSPGGMPSLRPALAGREAKPVKRSPGGLGQVNPEVAKRLFDSVSEVGGQAVDEAKGGGAVSEVK